MLRGSVVLAESQPLMRATAGTPQPLRRAQAAGKRAHRAGQRAGRRTGTRRSPGNGVRAGRQGTQPGGLQGMRSAQAASGMQSAQVARGNVARAGRQGMQPRGPLGPPGRLPAQGAQAADRGGAARVAAPQAHAAHAAPPAQAARVILPRRSPACGVATGVGRARDSARKKAVVARLSESGRLITAVSKAGVGRSTCTKRTP
jgi:hypothetical protein